MYIKIIFNYLLKSKKISLKNYMNFLYKIKCKKINFFWMVHLVEDL